MKESWRTLTTRQAAFDVSVVLFSALLCKLYTRKLDDSWLVQIFSARPLGNKTINGFHNDYVKQLESPHSRSYHPL